MLAELLIFAVTKVELSKGIIPHFNLAEFACKTCKEVRLNKELLVRLDILRKIYGKPTYITSGYRTPKYNAFISGAKTSSHMRGEAVDIALPCNPKRLIWIAKKVFPFVKVNLERNYMHLDLGE